MNCVFSPTCLLTAFCTAYRFAPKQLQSLSVSRTLSPSFFSLFYYHMLIAGLGCIAVFNQWRDIQSPTQAFFGQTRTHSVIAVCPIELCIRLCSCTALKNCWSDDILVTLLRLSEGTRQWCNKTCLCVYRCISKN